MDRAVFFPEHGVLPSRGPRKYCVAAQTGHPNGLAVVVDRNGYADGIAGERRKFPDLAWPWPPYHSFKIENLRPGAVDCHCTALWVASAILRITGHLA